MKSYKQTKDALILSVALVVIASPLAALAAGSLNVYNWADYIGDETIANFAEEYDVEIIYDNYDSVETVDAKLMAGHSGYDVVSHSSSSIGRLLPANILLPLDKSRLSNMKHMRADILNHLSVNWDPGNNYIVPFMWGTHGVTYNEELVRQTYPDAPIGSMDLIFDPVHMEKLAPCGVSFLDSPTDIIPMALAHLGFDSASTNPADYEKVGEMLQKVRPYIKTFDNYAYERMPEKEFCLAVTWGPDGLLAASYADEIYQQEVGDGEEAAADQDSVEQIKLDFYSPPGENKAQLWVDGWVIPDGAKNIDNAYLFLNYMMRPEVAAADSNTTFYATANRDAFDMISPDITSSPAAYPPPDLVEEMYTLANVPHKIARVRTRVWTKFVSGN